MFPDDVEVDRQSRTPLEPLESNVIVKFNKVTNLMNSHRWAVKRISISYAVWTSYETQNSH